MSICVLHILDHSIPLQSGYAFRTRSILREQRRIGWQTAQLTGPKHSVLRGAEEDVDEFKFHRTPWKPGAVSRLPIFRELAQMSATARRLEEVARIVCPDVLHAHSPVLNALPALWIGRKIGIPVVYEVRAFWEDAAVDLGTSKEGGLRYRLTRALETYAMRKASHVTTICEGLKKDIVARGIAESRVTVIPNGVDPTAFRFGTEPDLELKARLGLDGSTILGFIGSFYAYEGLDLLLEVMPKILKQVPSLRILLVGGGPQEKALKSRAKMLGVSDKIIFAGRVSHHVVQRYYSIVDVFVYPRRSMRLTELVTPLKPLEAMALGGIVLASDVGGHRELIRDRETGFLFRAGDVDALLYAIRHVLAVRDGWGEIRQSARHFVETERTWQRSVERYDRVYRDLLGRDVQCAALAR
jgi:glycogen(starch) synthase